MADELTQDQKDIVEHCDRIKQLLLAKNAAYGSSALDPIRVFSHSEPSEQLRISIDHKLSRLARGHAMPDESFLDTLDDLVGYILLLRISLARKDS